MYKVVGLLKRPEGVSHDVFKRWWLEEHAPKVEAWPGLVKYHINLAITDDQRYDGMAEVWFKTQGEMEMVFSTPQGERARGSADSGSGELVIIMTEEHVMVSD